MTQQALLGGRGGPKHKSLGQEESSGHHVQYPHFKGEVSSTQRGCIAGKWPGLSIPETDKLQETGLLRALLWLTLEKPLGVGMGPQEEVLTGGPQIVLRAGWPSPPGAPLSSPRLVPH